MLDLKKQKAKKVCFKTKRVCVRKNECHCKMTLKMMQREVFSEKRGG